MRVYTEYGYHCTTGLETCFRRHRKIAEKSQKNRSVEVPPIFSWVDLCPRQRVILSPRLNLPRGAFDDLWGCIARFYRALGLVSFSHHSCCSPTFIAKKVYASSRFRVFPRRRRRQTKKTYLSCSPGFEPPNSHKLGRWCHHFTFVESCSCLSEIPCIRFCRGERLVITTVVDTTPADSV